MAKNEKIINGKKYKVISAVVGHKINEAGNEVPVRKVFYGSTMKEARMKRDEYIKQIESNLDTKNQYAKVRGSSPLWRTSKPLKHKAFKGFLFVKAQPIFIDLSLFYLFFV